MLATRERSTLAPVRVACVLLRFGDVSRGVAPRRLRSCGITMLILYFSAVLGEPEKIPGLINVE